MLLVGLTGGIGSGKSTVAAMLERRGAVVIDADDLARRAVDPGSPGYQQVVEAFGRQLIADGGDIDRERLAQLVFADPEARRRLESIVHPEVARRFAQALEAYRDTDRVVVYVVPLLVERSLQATFDVVVAISASPEIRERRLIADRAMTAEEVRGRMAAQLSDEDRARDAHIVIENHGSLEQLDRVVDDLWIDLRHRAEAAEPG
jgi:dephospho-CoA kinase